MQEIKIYYLQQNMPINKEEPGIIIGEPCEQLLQLQKEGFCVTAQLRKLQGLSEEETAEALCGMDDIAQYPSVCIDASQLSQAFFRRVWCRHRKEPVVIGETDRLIIRESTEADGEAFWHLYQEEACVRFLEKLPVKEDTAEAYKQYIREYQAGQYGFYEYGMWSVIEKSSGQCIGRAGLEQNALSSEQMEVLSLGYALLPEYRGKGYALEACREILAYCKECGYADEVYVRIKEENTASLGVYEKLLEDSVMNIHLQLE